MNMKSGTYTAQVCVCVSVSVCVCVCVYACSFDTPFVHDQFGTTLQLIFDFSS